MDLDGSVSEIVVVGMWRECGIDDDDDLSLFCFVAREIDE